MTLCRSRFRKLVGLAFSMILAGCTPIAGSSTDPTERHFRVLEQVARCGVHYTDSPSVFVFIPDSCSVYIRSARDAARSALQVIVLEWMEKGFTGDALLSAIGNDTRIELVLAVPGFTLQDIVNEFPGLVSQPNANDD